MAQFHPAWLEHQRKRWRRHDWHRYVRPDTVAYRQLQDARLQQESAARKDGAVQKGKTPEELEAYRSELLDLKALVAELKWQLALRRFARKYSPDQPRVPAGNPDGGQWTSEGGGAGRARLAAGDKPRLGPAAMAAIAAEVARRAIEAYRRDNFLRDLFGGQVGTVTYTEFNGETLFGSNSTSPTYDARDLAAARSLRDVLVEKYPDVMATDNVGSRPNDALFHAETTILLRAARINGGTLAAQTMEIHGDRNLCWSCESVLPYVGLELGNPTVTFVDRTGRRRTIRDGAWID